MLDNHDQKSELRWDILKAFGADLDTGARENLVFVNKALAYPVGKHIIWKDIFVKEGVHKNDTVFIYLDEDIKKINCLNVSSDNYLLWISTESKGRCNILIYNLYKLSLASLAIYQPKRQVISKKYVRFKYVTFSPDGNSLACIGELPDGKWQGVIYDIQLFKKYVDDNYIPSNVFDLPGDVTKITYEEKIICTSGKNHLSFWFMFEHTCKEYKNAANINKTYVDHVWIKNSKVPTLVTATEDNDVIFFNAVYDTNKISKRAQEDVKIERFIIKQTLNNVFMNNRQNQAPNKKEQKHERVSSKDSIGSTDENWSVTTIKSFSNGWVIGSNQGNLLFIEKTSNNEYVPIRYTVREKTAKVTSLTFSSENEEYLAISFSTNEIAYISWSNIFINLKNVKFEITFNVICDGFHSGPITTMDVAQQRPIIITTSKVDKTIRVWNYLTGHCEYCKIILEEKDNNAEKEIDILSVAIHPNGYYIAISDVEMIRFFHLCYKELRFYNNDQLGSEPSKQNCELLKFSNGGHWWAAVCDKKVYLIRSFSRETVKMINAPHTGTITSIFFHPNDNFFYTSGTDGNVVQYNWFDFNYIKVANKYLNYTGSAICMNYFLTQDAENSDQDVDNIISCGYENSKQCLITSVNYNASHIEDISQCKLSSGLIDCASNAICSIHTKRYDINSIAIGTQDGKLCLYSHRIESKNDEIKKVKKFDSIQSHSKAVNAIYFSVDTNLLFSAGEDGNLFIYAVYEYPDGENVAFDDNKTVALTQWNSIWDEGLGDNVLINWYEIFGMLETTNSKQELIYHMQKQIDDNNKNFERGWKEKEMEMNKKKEMENKEWKAHINEWEIQKGSWAEHYEEMIAKLHEDHKEKLKQRDVWFNDKYEAINNQVIAWKEENDTWRKDFDKVMKNNEYDHLTKFRKLEYILQKKFNEMASKNEELTNQLQEQKLVEHKTLNIIELEQDMELELRNQNFSKQMGVLEKDIEDKATEIGKLKENKVKLEGWISWNENELKKWKENNENLTQIIINLRKQIDNKDKEKETWTKRITDVEMNLQEKSKMENFSNQLKNELYKQNYQINSKYNNELTIREELKESTKTLEKQLEETILLWLNREKEWNKQNIWIAELKQKWENQKHETNMIKKDFDNLIKKIYNTFQTNDKNSILNGIREIYHHYCSWDADKNFDSNKLNINVRLELEKQIDFLQKELTHVSGNKSRKENFQQFEYQKKMKENSLWIEEMTRIKKWNADITGEVKSLKFKNLALESENYKLKQGNLNAWNTSKANTTNAVNSVMNDSIDLNREGNKRNEGNIQTSATDDLPRIINPNMIIKTTEGSKNKPVNDLKSMRARIFKPGTLNIPNERLLKYQEMKRIIEGKNDIIMQLSTQNDLLRQLTQQSRNHSNSNINTSASNNRANSSGVWDV